MNSSIESVRASAYEIPTDEPKESDGTLEWTSTTIVLVEVRAGGHSGIGYTYADAAAAAIVNGMLEETLLNREALEIPQRYADMIAKIRNNGRSGITAMAISAVDIALWDLKGKLLLAPVSQLWGTARAAVPVYGSGGFTSYTQKQLAEQLSRWVHQMRIPRVKMKIGREPDEDPKRVEAARKAIGADAELFVDANGAYTCKQALELARHFEEQNVSWYEEPVYHNDLQGNRFVRDRAPAVMEVSNGEYGYAPYEFTQIVESGAADVLQADVTRCGGYSGFLAVDALCESAMMPLSSHCAPYVTLPVAACAKTLRHVEYFHDHVRIERMFFDGIREPEDGALAPNLDRPGIGLDFKKADAQQYAV